MREPNPTEDQAMSQAAEPCPREGDVLRALESAGLMETSLERHLESCPACRETVWLHGLLGDDAGALEAEAGRRQAAGHWRSPEALWTLARRQMPVADGAVGETVRQALWPIRLAERLSALLAILAVLWGLLRGWPGASGGASLLAQLGRAVTTTVQRGFGQLGDALTPAGAVSLAPSPEAVPVLLVLLSVAALAAGLWRSWADG